MPFNDVQDTDPVATCTTLVKALQSGLADFIVYGKLFTLNPDLPARFAAGSEPVPWDASTFYTPGPKGYTDYPPLAARSAAHA